MKTLLLTPILLVLVSCTGNSDKSSTGQTSSADLIQQVSGKWKLSNALDYHGKDISDIGPCYSQIQFDGNETFSGTLHSAAFGDKELKGNWIATTWNDSTKLLIRNNKCTSDIFGLSFQGPTLKLIDCINRTFIFVKAE